MGRLQRFGLIGAGVAVFTVGAGLGLEALRHQPANLGDLPVAPAATVRVVQSANVATQEDAARPLPEERPLPIAKAQPENATPPLPFRPPPTAARTAERGAAQEVPKPVATPVQKTPEAPKITPPAPARPVPARQEPQTITAVVLDEPAPRESRPQELAAVASAHAAVSVKQAAPAAPPVAKPTIERGTGLIAITPDGKVAVFTDPKTKLPLQFKIGEQLPGGDTIRSIDAKEGKVVTSKEEYSLD